MGVPRRSDKIAKRGPTTSTLGCIAASFCPRFGVRRKTWLVPRRLMSRCRAGRVSKPLAAILGRRCACWLAWWLAYWLISRCLYVSVGAGVRARRVKHLPQQAEEAPALGVVKGIAPGHLRR